MQPPEKRDTHKANPRIRRTTRGLTHLCTCAETVVARSFSLSLSKLAITEELAESLREACALLYIIVKSYVVVVKVVVFIPLLIRAKNEKHFEFVACIYIGLLYSRELESSNLENSKFAAGKEKPEISSPRATFILPLTRCWLSRSLMAEFTFATKVRCVFFALATQSSLLDVIFPPRKFSLLTCLARKSS